MFFTIELDLAKSNIANTRIAYKGNSLESLCTTALLSICETNLIRDVGPQYFISIYFFWMLTVNTLFSQCL